MKGITVETRKVAEGIYNRVMTDEDKTLVAYGMINKPVIDILEKCLNEKFDRIVVEREGLTPEQLDMYLSDEGIKTEESLSYVKKQWVGETLHSICKELYSVAADAGGMVV
jgi:hypothetical protein